MTLIFLGLLGILMFLVIKASLAKPNKLLKVLIHTVGGIVGLWLCDLLFSVLGLEVPINVFTIAIVAFLGFPGVIALSALQFMGI